MLGAMTSNTADNGPDEQDRAEEFDEEALGEDETRVEPPPNDGMVHGHLGSPDQLYADNISELVAEEFPTDDLLSPEESAMHLEDH